MGSKVYYIGLAGAAIVTQSHNPSLFGILHKK